MLWLRATTSAGVNSRRRSTSCNTRLYVTTTTIVDNSALIETLTTELDSLMDQLNALNEQLAAAGQESAAKQAALETAQANLANADGAVWTGVPHPSQRGIPVSYLEERAGGWKKEDEGCRSVNCPHWCVRVHGEEPWRRDQSHQRQLRCAGH